MDGERIQKGNYHPLLGNLSQVLYKSACNSRFNLLLQVGAILSLLVLVVEPILGDMEKMVNSVSDKIKIRQPLH